MIHVAVTGATGRMGKTVIETAGNREDVTVDFAVDVTDEAKVRGIDVLEPAEFEERLATSDLDVVIDFSVPDATISYVEAARDAGVAFVTGTTGFENTQFDTLMDASDAIPVLKAANFARGIQALIRVLDEAAKALPEYDVELTETHHNAKRDAPSGTAKTLLETLAVHRDIQTEYGREGMALRTEGEVGVHVRRAGDIRGEHELMFAGNDEVLTVTHRAEDRAVFAAGALDAASWLAEQNPGWYTFGNVIDDEQ